MAPTLLAIADTLLVRQVPPVRSGFEQAVFVAAGLAQILTLVVIVLLALIFHRMWKAQLALGAQIATLGAKIDPMIASATAAAENVRALTDAVKADAIEAAEKLGEATTRVRDSVTGIADRIDEFGDLMGKVQRRADEVMDVAGAAVRSVKWGIRALRPRKRRRSREASRDDVARRDTGEPTRLIDPDLDAGDEVPRRRPR